MSAMAYLLAHPEVKHGKVRVCFNPDEEIGCGAHLFDVEKFGCQWAYTMDGSEVGELEYENFNAASAKIVVNGVSVHPGYAKDKMVNAALLPRSLPSRCQRTRCLSALRVTKASSTCTRCRVGWSRQP
jgi:tripeptide aminopeptidase